MHVTLVGPEIEENLSLRYLAASLEAAGHDPELVPFGSDQQLKTVVRSILRRNPEMVGLSLVFQRRAGEYFRLIEELRCRGYRGHITAGGHFASLRAEEILRDSPGLDTILHHEGERRIVDLADLLERERPLPGEIDGISWRPDRDSIHHSAAVSVSNLDDLPTPIRKKPRRQIGIPMAPIVASRGCAGDCSFCSIRAWHRQVRSARLRLRSPQAVAEEMADLHRDLGVRIFIFHDDDFIHPAPKKALDRCRAILDDAVSRIGEPISFVIKCRPDHVEEELFAYLRSRGLDRVYVGIESHSESGLQTLNRRVSRGQNERALSILDSLGIYTCFNLLIFDPDTTCESLEENLRFLRRQVTRPFDIGRTELYAGAALERRMITEQRAFGDYRGWDYRIADRRVEATFRLFVEILWERHYGRFALAQGLQDLGYRLSLLRRFHPEAVTHELSEGFARLVREVGEETVRGIESSYAFILERRSTDTGAIERFVEEQRTDVDRLAREHARRLRLLSFEIEMRARLARLGLMSQPRLRRWGKLAGRVATSVPLALLALQSSSCIKEQILDPPPPPHIFSSDVEPMLVDRCGTDGCHDAASGSADLVFERGQSHDRLVGVPSSQHPAMDRAAPFEADSSYLVHKLRGTHLEVGGSGVRMPKGGEKDWELLHAVEGWIREGARDD